MSATHAVEDASRKGGKSFNEHKLAQRARSAEKRKATYAVPCTVCKRPAWKGCVDEKGQSTPPHFERRADATAHRLRLVSA